MDKLMLILLFLTTVYAASDEKSAPPEPPAESAAPSSPKQKRFLSSSAWGSTTPCPPWLEPWMPKVQVPLYKTHAPKHTITIVKPHNPWNMGWQPWQQPNHHQPPQPLFSDYQPLWTKQIPQPGLNAIWEKPVYSQPQIWQQRVQWQQPPPVKKVVVVQKPQLPVWQPTTDCPPLLKPLIQPHYQPQWVQQPLWKDPGVVYAPQHQQHWQPEPEFKIVKVAKPTTYLPPPPPKIHVAKIAQPLWQDPCD